MAIFLMQIANMTAKITQLKAILATGLCYVSDLFNGRAGDDSQIDNLDVQIKSLESQRSRLRNRVTSLKSNITGLDLIYSSNVLNNLFNKIRNFTGVLIAFDVCFHYLFIYLFYFYLR